MVTKRVKNLKNKLLSSIHSLSSERARLITDSYRETDGLPIPIRRAKAFDKILSEMKVIIRRDELIVGNQSDKLRAAPIFPEFGINFLKKELDKFAKRSIETYIVSEKTKQELIQIFPYWEGKTHEDRVNFLISEILPDEILKSYDFQGNLNQVNTTASHISVGEGHLIVDYEKILKKGLIGIIKEVKNKIDKLDLGRPETVKKKCFLESVLISCNAAIKFANRFANLVPDLLLETENPMRRIELQKIAKICKKVPANPADTFWEALQSIWFIHLIMQIETNGHGVSLGRFDQYLLPFYQKDIQVGRITEEEALELLECFWVKCNEISIIRRWSYSQYISGHQTFQTLTIGGQKASGEDAANEVSYLCLKATEDLKLIHPTLVVRIHKHTPEEFLVKCCETLVSHGGGLPGFFNDEIAVPLLQKLGVKLEDALNWGVVGCAEITVPGKFTSVASGVNQINLLKVLELTLNNGFNPTNGVQLLAGNGDLTKFTSFEEIIKAYRKQLRFYLKFVPLFDNIVQYTYSELNPTPFTSALIDSRIESAMDITEGNGSNYTSNQIQAHGLINVGNSLAAIKKLVFEEKIISLSELKEALDNNFKGKNGELVRQILLNQAPKYGNDDDYIDLIVKQVADIVLEEISYVPIPLKGGWYGPTFQTISANVPQGMMVGATPDGRKAGEPLADNISPAPGSDIKGPTAVFKSASKINHIEITNGTILNVKFHPSALEGKKSLRKFAMGIKTFFDLGGFQTQFNIVSIKTLKDAQKNPDQYRNLMVKVAGYSALFCQLDKKLQDQIIGRTEHVLLGT